MCGSNRYSGQQIYFGDNLLFIEGHDASGNSSDDMAWIFKACLDVVLGKVFDSVMFNRADIEAAACKNTVYELEMYWFSVNRTNPLYS